MRDLSQKDIDGLRYSADHYVKVKDQYLGMVAEGRQEAGA